MPQYSVTRSNAAFSVGTDFLLVTSASGKRARLIEVAVEGMGTSSAAGEVKVSRGTGGTTLQNSQTPAKYMSTDDPAAASTAGTNYSTPPTLNELLVRMGCNANGGVHRKVFPPDARPIFRNGESITVQPTVGTGNYTVTIVFEEI